jgi:hypothetical protein
VNRSESIAKISAALVKAQSNMSNATKGSANPFFKSRYADLNAIREACLPVLNAQGISVLQPTTVIDGKLYVETLLLHESGEFISGVYEVVVGKQNDPQALGAAISYSRRYGLQSMVNVGAEDDDAESAMGRNVKTSSKKEEPVLTNKTVVAGDSTVTTIDTSKLKTVEETPVKKGGFGVKKAETTVTAGTEDGWS